MTPKKSLLSNQRWISVPSEAHGKDWLEKCSQIDRELRSTGHELAEEVVFLLFDRSPGALVEGEGSCRVARSVTGPKSELPAPYQLQDVVSTPVWRRELKGQTLSEVLESAFEVWQQLVREGNSVRGELILALSRRLKPELNLITEGIFRE